ncbi:MAG: hypothetical protein VXY55_04970, partial [Pseudomonadota bacterium]|nr:hypothetical protein [Pseudomonadota bacterium]
NTGNNLDITFILAKRNSLPPAKIQRISYKQRDKQNGGYKTREYQNKKSQNKSSSLTIIVLSMLWQKTSRGKYRLMRGNHDY